MKRVILIAGLLMALALHVLAQKETYWWHLPPQNSLDFNIPLTVKDSQGRETKGMPTVGTGELTNMAGCFTLSSPQGELMMYFDGKTIWDRTGNPMPNGTGLLGSETSTLSGIVIPYPGSPGKYYAISKKFPVDVEPIGITYSVVDMSLRNGLGDVVAGEKNKPLLLQEWSDENIAAVKKTNSDNYWLIHRTMSLDYTEDKMRFYVWELTPSGFSAPVVYEYDFEHPGDDMSTGYLKFSSDGTRFVACVGIEESVTLCFGDFDPKTGEISNMQVRHDYYTPRIGGIYGMEFSMSGENLFFSTNNTSNSKLYHITWADLRDPAKRPALVPGISLTNIQMHSDGRIYGIEWGSRKLVVIMDPENGLSVDIRTFNDYLKNSVQLGLATFAATFMDLEGNTDFCMGFPQKFSTSVSDYLATKQVGYTLWDFGDGSTPVQVMGSGLQEVYHTYIRRGDYTIAISAYDATDNLLQSNTMKIRVNSCSLPVNHNMSHMGID
ncbi:PKD domain-containing protein [uncultured Dysgonomonas sp.]|uniref:PKD domain-containing protein n=1 Tax=uncultured Dysgonomonas sp. TaxID=206096 RepID=A0A212JWN9_9BACT|nr:PKD domain-containing protein [uncultured Dysgonomonas sp.]SBW03788.1 exported hypothetical protein [uncultured Dysgonomonas sp.]